MITPGIYIKVYQIKKVLVAYKVVEAPDDSLYISAMANNDIATIHTSEIVEVMPEGWRPQSYTAENEAETLMQFLQWLETRAPVGSNEQLVEAFLQWRERQQ